MTGSLVFLASELHWGRERAAGTAHAALSVPRPGLFALLAAGSTHQGGGEGAMSISVPGAVFSSLVFQLKNVPSDAVSDSTHWCVSRGKALVAHCSGGVSVRAREDPSRGEHHRLPILGHEGREETV